MRSCREGCVSPFVYFFVCPSPAYLLLRSCREGYVCPMCVLLLIFGDSSLAYLPAVYMQSCREQYYVYAILITCRYIERDVPWCASAGQTEIEMLFLCETRIMIQSLS